MNTLAIGYTIPLLGLVRDLHPLDNAHAERTVKSGIGMLLYNSYTAYIQRFKLFV